MADETPSATIERPFVSFLLTVILPFLFPSGVFMACTAPYVRFLLLIVSNSRAVVYFLRQGTLASSLDRMGRETLS